jgi:uncharacterized protein (TIGR02271 family)
MQEKRADQTVGNQPQIVDETAKTIIPVIEEQLVVDKYIVEKGKVRISKRISEHEEIVDEPLLHEEVKVERIPVNQVVEAPPKVRQEGETLIIPIVEEQIVVQKRLVLVEELRVRKELVETHQPQTVTLRKEEIEINRAAGSEDTGR